MKPQFRSNPYLRFANPTRSLPNCAAGFALTLCIAGLVPSAMAGSAAWNGNTGSTQTLAWDSNTNWTPNTTFPNGIGEIATITKDLTGGNTTINLSSTQNITVGTLLIGDVASSNTYTIAPNATTPFPLVFDNTGSTNAVLTSAPTSGTTRTDLISSNVVLEDSLDVSVGLNSLQISGSISETTPGKGLTKTGTGALYLGLGGSTTGNSYTGTTSIENGTVRLVGPAPTILGTGTSPVALGTANSISSNLSPTLQLNTDLTNPLARDITVGASNSPTTGVYTITTNNGSTGVSISGNITLNQNLTISGSTTGGFNVLGNITTGSSGAKTLTFSGGGGSFTSSGVIGGGTGTISLAKTGGNTLTVTGTNTYTGGTSIGGGTVVINSDAALGTAPGSPATNLTFTASGNLRQDAATSTVSLNANRSIVINDGATATFNANGATNVLTINGSISNQTTGVLNLVTSGTSATTGTVVLAGSNNFAANSTFALGGGNNLGGGILRLANNDALGSNAITINGNAGGGNALGETAIELAGGITVGGNLTYNIAGHTNDATPARDNLRNFSGNNTFNGAIRITTTGGSYQIDSAEAGSLLTLGGSITNTLGSTRNINFIGAGNTLISGTLAETGGSNSKITLTKYGTGALTLSNTYTFLGGVTHNQGTLNLNSTTALGAAAGTFIINGGTIDNTSGSAKTIANNNPLTLNGDFTFGTPAGVVGTNDLSLGAGAVTLGTAAGTSRTITSEGGGIFIIAGVIANGTTANSIIKNGSGVLKLDGANTYSGGTTLNAGQLQVNNNQALGTGPLTINGGTFVARNGGKTIANNATVNADFSIGLATFSNQMNFSGTIDLGGATRTITVVDNTVNPDSVMSGVISNGGLTKSGAGTLSLTGSNTYTGPTTVNGGTLSMSGGNPLDFTSSVTINGTGAKLVLSNGGTNPNPIILTQGALEANGFLGSITVADGIGNTVSAGSAGTSIFSGPVTFQGAATLNLFSDKTLIATNLTTNAPGQVVVNVTPSGGVWSDNTDYPIIEFTNYPSAADASHFTLGTTPGLNTSQHASLVRTANAIVLRITTDALLWTGSQSNSWTTVPVGGAKNWLDSGSPAEYTNTRSVVFDDSTSVLNVDLSENVSPSSVIFSGDFSDYTISSTGGFGIQSGALFKNGFAKATLATDNTYTGTTTISNGTLEVSGSISSSSSISIASSGTLALNIASAKTYANPITGAGQVNKSGAGVLTLTGANTFTGSFTLNAGTLNLNAPSALGAGPGPFIINGGTLDNTSGGAVALTGNKPQTWNADFSFTGSNNLDMGSGTVTLSGAGDRAVSPGGPGDTLIVGEIKSSLQGLNLSGGGTLVATSVGTFADGSNIAGTLTVGSGTTLQINRSTGNSGTNTGDFVTTGLAGSGTITNGAALTDRSIQSNNTADCTFSGTLADGGPAKLALNKQGTGTLTLTGNSTYTGQTVVGGGILNVRSSNALGNSYNVRAVSRNGGIQLQDNISLPSSVTFTLSNDGLGTVPYAIFNVSGNNTINGLITMTSGGGGSFIQSDSGTLTLAGNITSDQARPLTLLGASTGANTVSGVYSNGTTGVNTLTKSGPGTWILTGANTYTGATSINEGTLQLGNGSTDGTIATTSSVVNNAVLIYNWAASHAVPYVISGNGSVIKNGAGTASFTGVNTYTGTTTINAGELAVNGSSIVDTGTVVINGGKMNLTGAETVDKLYFGGVLQPAGVYSATSDATHFSGGGTLIVSSGPSGYGTWASAYPFTAGVNDGPTQDPDGDGISNLLEYVFGGVPIGTGASNTSIVPTQNLTATDLVLTFKRSDSSETDVTLKVQWSADMITWNDFATIGPVDALPQVDVTEDSPSASLDTVTVTIPRSMAPGGKLFARVWALK